MNNFPNLHNQINQLQRAEADRQRACASLSSGIQTAEKAFEDKCVYHKTSFYAISQGTPECQSMKSELLNIRGHHKNLCKPF